MGGSGYSAGEVQNVPVYRSLLRRRQTAGALRTMHAASTANRESVVQEGLASPPNGFHLC
jgi:hypothetical protein